MTTSFTSGFSFSVFGRAACDTWDRAAGGIDFDGDGKDDWYCIGALNNILAVYPSTGTSFTEAPYATLSFCPSENYVLGDVNGDRVALSPLTFQLFGGRYSGGVNAQLGKAMTLTITSRIESVDVAQLAAFGGSPDTISGTLTGAGTFSGSGADIAAVLESARGKGTATIANGEIRRLNLIRTIVLFFGRPAPDTAAGSDHFERIDANFSLANQIVRADALSMRSRDADIVGSGTMNVDTKALEGSFDLSLSEELSKQAGTDLARFTREALLRVDGLLKRFFLPQHSGIRYT